MANRSLVHSYVDRSLSFRERVPDANDENKLNLFTTSGAIVHNSIITNLIQPDKSSGRNESGLSLQLFIIANHFPLCKNCIRLFPISNFYPIQYTHINNISKIDRGWYKPRGQIKTTEKHSRGVLTLLQPASATGPFHHALSAFLRRMRRSSGGARGRGTGGGAALRPLVKRSRSHANTTRHVADSACHNWIKSLKFTA